MKNIVIGWFVLLVVFLPIISRAQISGSLTEENYKNLREFMYKNLQANFLDKSENKYSSYLCEVRLGEKVSIAFPDNTPFFIKDKQAQLESRFRKFLEEEGLIIGSDVVVIYPVLQIWKDNKPRKENIEEVLESLFGEGLNYNVESNQVRIESPIVISVLGVVS